MNKNKERKPLPKLPYGEGTMTYKSDTDDAIIYKKVLDYDGHKKRVSVQGNTAQECLSKMRAKEKDARELSMASTKTTLNTDMLNWLKTYKEIQLKPKSYDRLETTYYNQIKTYPIGTLRYSVIDSKDIQNHLNALIKEGLSYSTVKKVYYLFSDYYNFKTANREITVNPMNLVRLPSISNIQKPVKEIQYLTEPEIKMFMKEALSLDDKGRPKYKYGAAYVFVIYTGLRVGELMALTWKDIDFENKTVYIDSSLEYVVNRDYDRTRPDVMKAQGIKMRIQTIGTTKTNSTRLIALNKRAIEALETIKKYSKYTHPDDYVVPKDNGGFNTEMNLYYRLLTILRNTNIPKEKVGMHMLRHTCASLMFSKRLPVEIIASILGHSAEVCRRTYIHFCQEQKAEAIHKMPEFRI